nr:hypothetical protein [Tanacetum cinerariifolium]
MDITIDQQVTLDESLVPHASRLRIGKSNFPLRSDLKSKESTLQVVYDVLKLTPFIKTSEHSAVRCHLACRTNNEAIKNSKSYKEYYAIASGSEPPKTKANVKKKQSSSDTTMPPSTAKGKRLKTSAKVDKPAKEKQPAKSSKAKGLTVLSEVALTEAEQIKLATRRILTQTHISHVSGSGADEGTGIIPGVPDVPTYESDDEKISWKSSKDDDDNDDEEKINEESFDPIVQTSSQVENTDDEDSHGMNVEGANKKDEANELYRDMNINLEGRDIQITDVQTTQVIEDTHVTLTPVNPKGQQQSSSMSSRFVSNMLNPSPDTVTLKRRRDKEDKDEEPFARSNQGSKRRRAGKEPESTSAPKKKTSKTSGKSADGSKSHHKSASKSAPAEEPMHTTQDLEEPAP